MKPLVVIECVVYNHEPYLRECLDGFIMQQTNFPFVVMAHDDKSTDRSADIILEYAAKYPDIIKPFIETENQWSKKNGSLQRAMYNANQSFSPKYIAICEGDDYWTDPLKLQKQVDILEADESLMGVYSDSMVVDDKSIIVKEHMNGIYENLQQRQNIHYYFDHDLLFPTASVVWRNNHPLEVQNFFENTITQYVDDWNLWIAILIFGDFYHMTEVTCAYRIQPNSITHTNSRVARAKADRLICKRVAYNLPPQYEDIANNLRKQHWVWIKLMYAYKSERKYLHMFACMLMVLALCPGYFYKIILRNKR